MKILKYLQKKKFMLIKNKKYYVPKDIGYERQIKEIYEKLEQIKKHNDFY